MMDDLEPYAAPRSQVVPPDSPHRASADARSVFLAWERLRVVYNAVLVIETLVLALPLLTDQGFLVIAVEGAIAANLAFCAGPVAEGYLDLLALPRVPSRWVLMIAGTLLAMLGTLIVIVGYSLKDF